MQRLKISENKRYLIYADGTPFFYLGDTAWELFHRLDREEADYYLQTRADQGYTVIQAAALAEFGGLTEPNPYGDLALHHSDPTRPNDAYFQHIDWIINRAEALGLYVALLPTWGDKWNKAWGEGPEIFTPENARVYGEFLGKRYKDKPILWVLGGDRAIENETHLKIYEAMADGVTAGDGGANIRTFHPKGGESSSLHLHDNPRLDFNMLQSGHGARNIPNYAMIAADYERSPARPCLDAEPNYEEHPINWKPENGYFNEYDVRKSAYQALFAGAFGLTYGCQCVWQFYAAKRHPVAFPRLEWREALHLPGANQMRYARRLMESRPFLTRVPDQSLLSANYDDPAAHQTATRDKSGDYGFVYAPLGLPVRVALAKICKARVRVSWFNPRTGETTEAGTVKNAGSREFLPPTSGQAQDWVLILDAE